MRINQVIRSMEYDNNARAANRVARIGEDPGITTAVDSILRTLTDIARALTPVIGNHGVAALYQRSVLLCATRYPDLDDLASRTTSFASPLDFAPLRMALLMHDVNAIRLCGADLLHTLNQLLTSLIGASLSERLLRSAWENSLCGPPPQDALI